MLCVDEKVEYLALRFSLNSGSIFENQKTRTYIVFLLELFTKSWYNVYDGEIVSF